MPELFGHMPDGRAVHRTALDNGVLRVQVLEFGAVLQSIEAPGRDGRRANVVLGLTELADYVARSPHFGAVPGRYAGRIGQGRFTLDGVAYQLECNAGGNALHGGPHGFGKRAWSFVDHGPTHATLALDSPDGDAGYPGHVRAQVEYRLDGPALHIGLRAETDRDTILNLTNHSYFNLAGEGSGDVMGHELTLWSDRYYAIGATNVPTGALVPVDGTAFDFRAPRRLGSRIRDADPQLLQACGYDHAFALPGEGLRRAAHLLDPGSGRTMTLHTTQPAVQLYTANSLTGALAGPSGRAYRQGDAVCLEAQHPQDSPNHPDFPGTVLRPGRPFAETIIFEFGATAAA